MADTNEQEKILKTIQTSDFADGGRLNPKRQNQFLKYIRTFGKMMPMVRFEALNQSQMILDKFYIGEPVSHAVEENDNTAFLFKPSFGQINIQTKKLKSSWNITTETLTENIEQQGFESTMMQGMTQRIATDVELLAIQGDETVYSGATDVFGRLLKRQDGWDKLTNNSHILDVGGANVQKGIFAEMIRTMPQAYLQDPNLKWFMSKSLAIDWLDLLADRGTAIGDRALNGETVSPYGIPIVEVPLIPDNKSVTANGGISARVLGTMPDPFTIRTGVNDKVTIAIDGGANVAVTLPNGTHRVGRIAAVINGTAGLAGVASDDSFGRLVLKSPTVGAGSSVAVVTVSTNAYTDLGLTVATTVGTNNGTVGTTNDGTFIWLANPKNFIAAMRGTTRVYTWFNKDFDRLETVVYNELDFMIENDDAIVKAVNVRKRSLI